MRSMLTIAVVLLAAAVVAAAWGGWNRWRFTRVEGAFRCNARAFNPPSGLWPHLRRDWPRRRIWARWEGNILVARQGLLCTQTVALAVKIADNGIRSVPANDVRRCGRRPLVVNLMLPDGSRMELAAPDSARIAMVGPFLAAAVHALPHAPTRNHRSPRRGC
jgi:hypothetical protein